MTDNKEIEVYRAWRSAEEKYIYFLLTAAGAGIALAVNQTQGAVLALAHLPLAAAILSWGLSFYFGCRHLSYVSSTMYSNMNLLNVLAGKHPEVGSNPEMIHAASKGIKNAMISNFDIASSLARWQFRSFVAGAICYVAWHVLEMYLGAAA